MTFPNRLRGALQRINVQGKPFATGVFALGILLIILQGWMIVRIGQGVLSQLRTVVSEERYGEIVQEIDQNGIGGNAAQIAETVGAELSKKFDTMTEAQRTAYLFQFAKGVLQTAGPFFFLAVVLVLCIQLFAHGYFLLLMAKKFPSFGATITATSRALPRLIAVWIGFFLCSGFWLPLIIFAIGFVNTLVLALALPSFILPILLLPRFIFAPVLLVQEGLNVRDSLHASYQRTRGKWWTIVRNLIGAFVVLWIFSNVAQSILDALVQALLPYSGFGFALYSLSAFVALIAMGYRQSFLVLLKEETAS